MINKNISKVLFCLILFFTLLSLSYSFVYDKSEASFIGEEASDYSGRSVAGIGDVNNDGYDDIAIGAHLNDAAGSGSGQVYIFFGKSSGWNIDTDLSDADATFIGENGADFAGGVVAGIGDVNGDGIDDMAVGAYGNDDGGTSTGQVYVIFGRSGGWSVNMNLASADASFTGESINDEVGEHVAGVGDVNNDGYDDIAISTEKNDEGGTDTGQTYIIFGKNSGWSVDVNLSNANASFWGENEGDKSGISVTGVGDINDDGIDDMAIGAYLNDEEGSNVGQTYLIFGRSSGWSMDINLSNANASFVGENPEDYSGLSVAGVGDVNGDGINDMTIGAYGNTEGGSSAGQTYVIFGKGSGWSMDVNLSDVDASFIGNASDQSGHRVAGVGDFNNDGFDDITINAYYFGSATGKIYLLLGRQTSGWSMDMNISNAADFYVGENSFQYFVSLSGLGDVNNDGFDDFIVGGYGNDDGGNSAGKSYVIFGKSYNPTSSAVPNFFPFGGMLTLGLGLLVLVLFL